MTKLVIHPKTTTTGVTVIPFLVDVNEYNVIVIGETYTINTTEGVAYEIVFDTPLTASQTFYFGTYESIETKHQRSGASQGRYLWELGEPVMNSPISTGSSAYIDVRSTQGYGF